METTHIEARGIPLLVRRDLEIAKLRFRGEPCYVVKDPLALKYYHLRPPQFRLLSYLDGKSSPEQIKQWLSAEFPTIAIRVSDIRQLAADLHQKGLTTSTRKGQRTRLLWKRRKRIKEQLLRALASPLFMRSPAINPGMLVRLFTPLLGWMFTRTGACLAAFVIVSSWIEAAIRWDELSQTLPSLGTFFGWPNLIWLWMIIGCSKILHEMGHAVACEKVGRRCSGIGAALLVFSPTLYCDATDSWMSVNKWQRILVSASGIYVELLIGAIAMFVWSHTFPGTLHSIALNAAAISTVSTVIFNANPLIKFDGYYIFSDLIEVPNLQETSSRCLSRSAAWCLGFSLEKDVFSPKSGRHWFASYAVLSFIYRWFILAVILWTIHQVVLPYRVESATGIWATVVMAMMSWQLFRQGKSVVESRKPGQHNFRRLVITSVVVSLALVVLFFVPLRLHHRASVYVELQEPISIYTSTGGTVVSVQSKAGEMVQENDTILVLENPEIEDKLRLLVEQRHLTSSAIRTFESVGNHSKLAIMQKELLSLERRIREIKPLIDALSLRAPHSGVVYDGQFEPPAVHSVQKTLNWSGWLLDSRNEGAFLPAGTLVAKVSSTRQCEAILYVDQDVLEDIAIDQMVTIRLDAFPDIDLQGTVVDISASGVDEIAPIASQQFGGRLPTVAKRDGSQGSEVKLFQIAVAIDTTVPITPGMRGRAKLLLNERSMAAWGYRLLRNTFYFRF